MGEAIVSEAKMTKPSPEQAHMLRVAAADPSRCIKYANGGFWIPGSMQVKIGAPVLPLLYEFEAKGIMVHNVITFGKQTVVACAERGWLRPVAKHPRNDFWAQYEITPAGEAALAQVPSSPWRCRSVGHRPCPTTCSGRVPWPWPDMQLDKAPLPEGGPAL